MLRRPGYFLFAATLFVASAYGAGCAHVTPADDQLDGADDSAGGAAGSNGDSGAAGSGTAGNAGSGEAGSGGTAAGEGGSAGEGGTAGDGGAAGDSGEGGAAGDSGTAGSDAFGGSGGGNGGIAGAGGCGGQVLVINEVLLADFDDENAEYVEILNKGTCAVNLNGFTLQYLPKSGTGAQERWKGTSQDKVGPGEYFIVATDIFDGQDAILKPGLSASAGALGLCMSGSKTPFEAVTWGSVTNPKSFLEGSAASAPPKGMTLSRIPNGIDTDNNASDFEVAEQTPGDANLGLAL